MPYLIETFDKPGAAAVRQAAREEHLAFLAQEARLLLACGAKLSDDGSAALGGFYIVDLETREAAQDFIDRDPFSRVQLFSDVRITRWRKAYLDGACFL
ncbi:hypothetical protein CCO03_05695 [Comamonas serinivorans]|uniref:YCII-related domain-containing protein n=1 Tax=Comamonas serinivorans TaxID=1082851 RepID=A0A1Y0ELE3_9BURK|nr:YciI family protein [Comamonas serinivorans]ARU04240.1 hypothetical protein CCO03_05695 [Comamonas serinivorans]